MREQIKGTLILLFFGGLIYAVSSPEALLGGSCPIGAISEALSFLGITSFDNTSCSEIQVPSLHLNLLMLRGVEIEGDTVPRVWELGLQENSGFYEVVTMAKLAPRNDSLSTEVRVSEGEAVYFIRCYLEPDVLFPPEDFYSADSAHLVVLDSIGPEKFWRTNDFVHRIGGVRVMPSVFMADVDAMYNGMITYAYHKEEVTVSTTPSIDLDSAWLLSEAYIADFVGVDTTALIPGGYELVITYPNHIFAGEGWQWSDRQVLCWRCEFWTHVGAIPVVTVWVNARDGRIEGGEIYEGAGGVLFCLASQQDDYSIWKEELTRIGADFAIVSGSATVGEVQTSLLSEPYFFMMQTEGGLGRCEYDPPYGCETAALLDPGSELWFCPNHVDELGVLDIRWVLMSCCYSGNLCPDNDQSRSFRVAFPNAGVDLYQGYLGDMDPDLYEQYQAYFLEQGETFANAHQLSKVFDPPGWQRVIYNWADGAYNGVRLAPLLVGTNSDATRRNPAEAGKDTFCVWAAVVNRDDFRQASAESVVAVIQELPLSFFLFSDSVQVRETLEYGDTLRVYWEMLADTSDSGVYPIDVWVSSKNLSVALEEPGDKLNHRCWVHIEEYGGVEEDGVRLPMGFALLQNYPNPFNPTTIIPYTVPEIKGKRHNTTVKVYNIAGHVVKTLVDDPQSPGEYQVAWDGRNDQGKEVSSGVYLYRLQVGDHKATRRMVLLR